jgi:hypothetical protein
MTQPNPGEAFPVTLQRAWAHLTQNMGLLNLQRARDAQRALRHLRAMRRED